METMSFKSLLKKERAAKDKADKSKKTAASSYNFGAFSAPKPVVKPKTTPVSKPKPKPVATSKAKPKPAVKSTPKVVVSSKGKTVYAPKAGTKTVYNSKGKTVYKSKDDANVKTTYNKQGKTEFYNSGQKATYNKQGLTIYNSDGSKRVYNKQGKTGYNPDGSISDTRTKNGLTIYPDAKSTVKKPGTGTKPAATTKPGTGKPTPKPTPKPAVKTPVASAKPAAKTVSQLWTEKTGTSWSEAKKQGLSDGSAKSNLALMKKLESGSVNKETIATMKDNSKVATLDAKDTKVTKSSPAATTTPATTTPVKSEAKPTAKQMAGSGMGAMERMEGMYRRGGSIKKYQNGGMTGAAMKAKGTAMKAKGEGMKLKGQGQAMKVAGKKMQAEGDVLKYAGQNPVRTKISKSLGLPLQSRPTGIAGTYMKTGGMVNSNAKISALKSAGSKGVKSGVNPKAAVSKVAKGRVGGTSAAPKTATPKRK